jgi:iron complex outermembrane recepter protein
MALHTFAPKLTFIALACTASLCLAQEPAPQRIVISGRAAVLAPDVAGFGDDTPAARTPLQTLRIDDSTLHAIGARNLAALTQLDPSVGDAYNSAGYWSALTIRGFALDQRSNYRRDGLPISAETAIALDNKSALELMKGISGVQAGVSAPGGLVNFIVKRPSQDLLAARLEARQGGGSTAALDVAHRWGADRSLGLRLNAAYEHLDPALGNARGHRKLLALAGDWRVKPGTLIEAEVEWSAQRQPSQPGFSLLGSRVPDADEIDPRISLNNQAWSQPVAMSGSTASLRITQELSPDTRLRLHAAVQRLASDDRVAFPFGCSAENVFDRYCNDGSFDLYDYRSDGERRRTDAIDASLHIRQRFGAVAHQISAGVLVSRYHSDLPPQAFNYAGTGTIDGLTAVPAATDPVAGGSQSRERSVEWYVRDRLSLNDQWSLWAGLRHTALRREARQSFTTPWLALAWQATPQTMLYASAGQGVESVAAPNLVSYRNAGRALSLKASQVESGLKVVQGSTQASVALFAVRRPQSRDIGNCDASPGSCERVIDGHAQHQGLEAQLGQRFGAVQALIGAQVLQARRRGSSEASLNGLVPPNVASHSWRATLSWSPLADGELALHARHEGSRFATPDNSARIPAWTQLDLTARWQHRSAGHDVVWQAGIDNLGDTRAWKESPYQFGHAYLYPVAPRLLRLSLAVQR